MNYKKLLTILPVFISLILVVVFITNTQVTKDVKAATPPAGYCTSEGTVNWIGGTDNNWNTSANWDQACVPWDQSDAVIDLSTTVNLTTPIDVKSLTIGNSGATTTPILNFSYDASTLEPLTIVNGDLVMYSGSKITHSAGTSTVVGYINIDIQNGDLNLNTGASIDTNGRGYAHSQGPGQGANAPGSSYGSGGGGYAGPGGNGSRSIAGGSGYSDYLTPTQLGSGGGDGGYTSSANGGAGGGAMQITISGNALIEGTLTSNGVIGGAAYADRVGGGGSGGSISITTGTISGSGTISANGGDGRNNGACDGGGGSGGRIGIIADTNTFSGTISANGGLGPDSAIHGASGTIYSKLNADTYGSLYLMNTNNTNNLEIEYPVDSELNLKNLTIDSGLSLSVTSNLNLTETFELKSGANLLLESTGDITYSGIIINAGSEITDNGGSMPYLESSDLTIPENVTLYSHIHRTFDNITVNGTLSHLDNSSADLYKIYLSANNNFTINSTGAISLDGKGFYHSAGDGAGSDVPAHSNGAGGAGHAGVGGDGHTGYSGGIAYGSELDPVTLGSGGGDGGYTSTANGGDGGGAVKLVVGNTLTINGPITANGLNGGIAYADRAGAGGSGGSINLRANYILGDQDITANGGNGGDNSAADGGGGSGGRIAIYYSNMDSYTGAISATGGTGPGAALDGYTATAYTEQVNATPNTPDTLVTSDGSWLTTNNPALTFNLTDPDDNEDVKYQIQIDNNSDFSSPEIDYTSAITTEGSKSFTIGQPEGSGSYTTGSESQTLDELSYYWRVKAIDDELAESAYTIANSGSIAFKIDTQKPTGTVYINLDDTYTTSTSTTITLNASDSTSGITNVMLCDNETFTDCTWEVYETSKSYTLSQLDGTKTIYVKFKDLAGNESITYTDQIILDTNNPTGTVQINNGDILTQNTSVQLTISAQDLTTEVEYMKISEQEDLSDAEWINYSSTKDQTLSDANGTKNIYIKFKDQAGNESPIYSDNIILDTQKPTGSISINNNQPTTTSRNVTLNISATDNISDVEEMRICTLSSFTNCSWQDYSTTLNYTLTSGNGIKRIYIQFKDSLEVISDTYSDTITLSIPTPAIVEPEEEEEETTPEPIVEDEVITEEEKEEVKEKIEEVEESGSVQEKEGVVITLGNTEVETEKEEKIHIYKNSEVKLELPVQALTDIQIENEEEIEGVYAVLGEEIVKLTKDPITEKYVGTLTAKDIEGDQNIDILTIFKDGSAEKKILGIAIDPYGYIYSLNKDGNQIRLKDATVTLYKVEDGNRSIYVSKNQSNPQTTDIEGEYSFFVTPGTYALTVEVDGYTDYDSGNFEVEKTIIEMNIEMEKDTNILSYLWYSLILIPAVGIVWYIVEKRK